MPHGRRPDTQPTERELEVLSALWAMDSGGRAEDVVEHLSDRFDCDFNYKTVLTVLRILVRKGWARRHRQGHGHRYFAVLDQDRVQYNALFRLCHRAFAGDKELMIEILRGIC